MTEKSKTPSFSDAMNDFKMKPEYLERMGLNEDYTEKEGYVPPDKLDYDARITELISDKRDKAEQEEIAKPEENLEIKTEIEKEPEEKLEKEETEEKPEKKEGEPVSKTEQPEPPENKDKKETPEPSPTASPLDEFTQQLLEISKKYDSPEKRNELLRDLDNRDKFWASVTQKSQSLAAEKKVFDDFIQGLTLPEIKNAFDDAELMEALDDWYEGEEKNPFRKFPEILKHISAQERKAQEDFDRELDNQINQLKSIDKKYDNFDEIVKLSKVADEKGINLLVAHELLQSNLKGNTEINSLKSQVVEKDKTIEKLTNELKERNEELSKIRKSGKIEPIIKPGASGVPAKSEAFDTKAVGFDEKTKALRKHLRIPS